jgi:hypothetical protein
MYICMYINRDDVKHQAEELTITQIRQLKICIYIHIYMCIYKYMLISLCEQIYMYMCMFTYIYTYI